MQGLTTSRRGNTKSVRYFYLLLLLLTLVKLPSMAMFPLTGDEAYHWEWSRRLAPAYYDHPGAVAWGIALSTWLTGISTEWSVRMSALLAMIGVSLLAWRLTRRVALDQSFSPDDAERAGGWVGLSIASAPVFAVLGIYMSTDPPLLFFWMLALYFGYCGFRDSRMVDWLGLGVALGLALSSKFLAFLLVVAFLATVFGTRDGRRSLGTFGPWLALTVAFALFLPVLIWNARNDWSTFRFNFMIRQADALKTFSWRHVFEYLGGQVLAVLPGTAILGVLTLGRSFRRLLSRNASPAIVFLWLSAVIPLGAFFLISWKRRIGLHWPVAGWLGTLVLALVEWFPRARGEFRSRGVSLLFRTAVMLPIILFFLASVSAWALYAAGPFSETTWLGQMWNSVYGWKEAGRRIADEKERLTRETGKGTALFGRSYAIAAQVAFYTPGHPTVSLWAPSAVHGQEYRRWNRFESYQGSNVLLVARHDIARVLPWLREHCRVIGEPQPLVVIRNELPIRLGEWVLGEEFNGHSPDWTVRPSSWEPAVNFSGHRAFEEVRAFVEIGPRPAGSEGMERAAAHVADRLGTLGLEVKMDIFEDKTPKGKQWFRNVEGHLKGQAPGCVILVSHLDTKTGISSNFIGANDSGSSTGFLIELARTLKEQGWEGPDLYFLFVDGEECLVEYGPYDGLHGSRRAASRWKASPLASAVRAVLVLDMIGDRDLSVTIPRNSDIDLIRAVFRAAEKEGLRSFFRLHRQTILDDHVPFLEAGFPTVLLIDFEYGSQPFWNDWWHTEEDTLDKLSPESLEKVGRVVLRFLYDLTGPP